MTSQEQEEANNIAKRGGDNQPLGCRLAWWDGNRSIRIEMPQGHVGLATTTYSYHLTHDEREQAARRIAALWTLAAIQGWDTETIEAMCREPKK